MTRTCGGEEYFMPTLDRILGLVFIHVHIVQCTVLQYIIIGLALVLLLVLYQSKRWYC